MRRMGLFMVVIGLSLIGIGALLVYTSLRDYTDCVLAPSVQCTVTGPTFVRYLSLQLGGNYSTFYGITSLLVGTIFLVLISLLRETGVVETSHVDDSDDDSEKSLESS